MSEEDIDCFVDEYMVGLDEIECVRLEVFVVVVNVVYGVL